MKLKSKILLGTFIGLATISAPIAVSLVATSCGSSSSSGGNTTPSTPPQEVPIPPTPEELFDFDPTTGTITGFHGPQKAIVFPETINGVKVTKIGDHAFEKKELTYIKLPETLEEIGDFAFIANYFPKLIIPASVKYIRSNAFQGNPALADVQFNEGNLLLVGWYCFADCRQLLDVRLPDSLASPEASELCHGSFWWNQPGPYGTPKKVSLKRGTKLPPNPYDVFTTASVLNYRE